MLLSGEVDAASGNQLTLFIERQFSEELPSRGQLVIDISAAKEAINRQKSALDAVRFDRAVRGDLRNCWYIQKSAGYPRTWPKSISFSLTSMMPSVLP